MGILFVEISEGIGYHIGWYGCCVIAHVLTGIQRLSARSLDQKDANKFVVKAERTISLIAGQPFMFKASTTGPDIRIGVITRQCSLF